MKIQVLGSGCNTCRSLYSMVEEVAKKINSDIEVEYSTDIAKIVELGVMSSPVLVINGKLITSWKIPTKSEVEQAILMAQNAESD